MNYVIVDFSGHMLGSILAARAGLQSTNDYNKYRKSASRKVSKLRHQYKLVQAPQKGHATHPKMPVEPEHYQVALWLAERAWSAGMEVKSALEATESPLLKKQLLSKLAKARKFARQATALAETATLGSELDRVELLLYETLIAADLAIQQKNWNAVVELCSVARTGCEVMAKRTNEPLFGDVIVTKIDPALRFAAQKTGKVKADVQRLAKSVTAAAAEQQTSALAVELGRVEPAALRVDRVAPSEELGAVKWRSHEARVENADLAQAILLARAKTAALGANREAADYDEVLLAWQEASDAAHDLVSDVEAKNSSSDAASQNLYIVATYIDYTVLVNRIDRDVLIIKSTSSTLSGLRDAVRLYDGILQSCMQLLELPGVYNDDELSSSLETLQKYFASRRCETVGRGYAAVDNHAASLALVVRAQSLISGASPVSVDELPVSASQVKAWEAELKLLKTKRHGLASLLSGPSSTSSFISDNISVHPVGTPEQVLSRLANLEGHLQPVAVKPVFYDIAFNYIDADDEYEESAPQQPKKLFGLF